MTDLFSEEDSIAAIAGLTPDWPIIFIAAEVIISQHGDARPVYRRIDIARMCELSDDLDLDMPALENVMSLIDQIHDASAALRALAKP